MVTSQICNQLVNSAGGLGTPKVCLVSDVGAVLWRIKPSAHRVCTNAGRWVLELDDSTPGGVRLAGDETESSPYFVSVILNFKSKNLLSKGVKYLVPKLRYGQICPRLRKTKRFGFGQLKIQISLPGGHVDSM